MARRTLLVIASILLAALGTALIWLYVQGAENRAQQNAQLVPALFLTRNVAAGQPLGAAVEVQEVPAPVAANAVTSLQELGTKTLQVNGFAGQVLLRSMLTGATTPAGAFPAGGAASVTINDPNRVPAELKPGDSVDVVELSKNSAVPVTTLADVTVRSIGTATQAGSAPGLAVAGGGGQNGSLPATIVGLNVSHEQAVDLYTIVAKGDQVALYLHAPKSP